MRDGALLGPALRSLVVHLQAAGAAVGAGAGASASSSAAPATPVAAAGAPSELRSKAGKDLVKKDLTIADDSGIQVALTLWGEKSQL